MYSDRELLELAARAAGVEGEWNDAAGVNGAFLLKDPVSIGNSHYRCAFNPLRDDGDALRLAVMLNIPLEPSPDGCLIDVVGRIYEPANGDPCSATRRTIVRAAASIGEAM